MMCYVWLSMFRYWPQYSLVFYGSGLTQTYKLLPYLSLLCRVTFALWVPTLKYVVAYHIYFRGHGGVVYSTLASRPGHCKFNSRRGLRNFWHNLSLHSCFGQAFYPKCLVVNLECTALHVASVIVCVIVKLVKSGRLYLVMPKKRMFILCVPS